MTSTYTWYESYLAAVLETDWTTKMHDRIQAAESSIVKRQHALYEDHGGSPEERQALDDAIIGLKFLRTEVHEWLSGRRSNRTKAQPD